MAALKAEVLGGSAAKSATLEAAVFGAELKRHIVHEVVRAELNAHRAGTRGAKTRGLVSGGRAKPWRQKGTGRARQGTIRAPHFTGGGVAFAPGMRSFDVKVNRKVRRAAGCLARVVGIGRLHLEGRFHRCGDQNTGDEERAPEDLDPDVAENYEEMIERGADQRGEGRIP